jgi:hypothetical protein
VHQLVLITSLDGSFHRLLSRHYLRLRSAVPAVHVDLLDGPNGLHWAVVAPARDVNRLLAMIEDATH